MVELSRRKLFGTAAAVGGVAAISGGVAGGTAAQAGQGAPASKQAKQPPPFGGTTIEPADPQYIDVVRGTNQRFVGSPEYVRLVGTTKQVVAAVQEAVDAGKRIQVRSGGHCYEDFVYNADIEVVVDMSVMNNVYFDSTYEAYAVEAGAELRDVYEALYKGWGVTLPGGSCGSVGAGGHICAGGYGLLSRFAGLTIDYLYGVEVVVVDGSGQAKAVVGTAEPDDPHHDLWWAHTGGGGGSLGIVTRYLFRDPPTPPREVFVSAIGWPWADMTQAKFRTLLSNWGAWHEANSAPDSPYKGLFGLLKLFKLANDGSQIQLTTQMDATVPNAGQLLQDYLDAISAGVGAAGTQVSMLGDHPALSRLQQPTALPWFLATDWLSGSNPNLRFKNKSSYHRKSFTEAQVDVLYEYLSRTDYTNPEMLVQVDSYGCQVNTVAADATANPQRDSILKSQFQVYWTDPAEDAEHLTFLQEMYRDTFADTGGVPVPNDVTDGCYIGYPDTDLSSSEWNTSDVPWSTLYYKDNYARLREVKNSYDPGNIFSHAQSIEL